MSIELPEAQILAKQMNKELQRKQIKSYQLRDCEKLQRIGFVNKDAKRFDGLVNRRIESVTSRGNVLRVKLDSKMNLILSPEYGGRVLYHAKEDRISETPHLRLDFSDGTVLTVRLTGMGVILVARDDELQNSYVYKRDFSETPSPANEEFTPERFSRLLAGSKGTLKSALVGKDAVVVGLGNSAFQDIAHRAKIHPKRKPSELSEQETRELYKAIKQVLQERIRKGGKSEFSDLFGKQGSYVPAMGSNKKRQTCQTCGTPIEFTSLGGGQAYFCPKCQR